MAFGCTVVSTVTRLRSWLRNAPASCATRRLSASSNSSLSPEPLAPMAQVRALVRESVLEELFAGEELEIRVLDPALAHPLIGQPVNLLEQQQPDHEAGLDPRPAVLAVERCDLAVDPIPIDLAGEQNQLVIHVDDLVQPRPEQIVRSSRPVLLRPHRPLRCTTESWSSAKGNPQNEIAGFGVSISKSLQSKIPPHPKKQNPDQSLGGLFTDDAVLRDVIEC